MTEPDAQPPTPAPAQPPVGEFFERLPLASWIYELSSRVIVAANDAASAIYGYTRDEFLTMRIDDLRPPEELPRLISELAALRTGSSRHHHWRHVTKGARSLEVEVMSQSIELDGRPCRWVVAVDVGDAVRAEGARFRTEQLFRVVLESAPWAIYRVDAKGVFTMNEGRALVSSLAPGFLVGKRVRDAFADVRLNTVHGEITVDDCVRRVLSGESMTVTCELEGKQLENTIVPERDPSGVVEGYVGVARDITAQRRLDEQMRTAHKMEAIGQLAGGVAHDFNNMLTLISSACAALRAKLPPGAPVPSELEDIQFAADRSASLTRQLLAFGRQQVLQPRVLDVNALVVDSSALLARLLGEHIALRLNLKAPNPRVSADPGRLQQVLVNLLVNARDAMPNGGELVLETTEVEVMASGGPDEGAPGRYVMLCVRDTGTGMTPDVKARAFEPFFTTKGSGRGTGMGLASVYGTLRQSGGHVRLESTQGVGTSVYLYLPLVAQPTTQPSVPPAVRELRGTETILLVEDEERLRSVFASALR
ncbi:MAG: PAS domain S-box protein, partial [Deltaproteobacteria bacterium]|nr:PAS domain S-box protein [Deltaproteobacteria bacterium]